MTALDLDQIRRDYSRCGPQTTIMRLVAEVEGLRATNARIEQALDFNSINNEPLLVEMAQAAQDFDRRHDRGLEKREWGFGIVDSVLTPLRRVVAEGS